MANQDYLGPMPPMDAYDPEGMSPKKKQEFEMWYSEQVQNEYEFNMRREMEEYCISDVKLLKAGCQKFQAEFYKEAEFHPMEKVPHHRLGLSSVLAQESCLRLQDHRRRTTSRVAWRSQ